MIEAAFNFAVNDELKLTLGYATDKFSPEWFDRTEARAKIMVY